jgi:hypothetical protein
MPTIIKFRRGTTAQNNSFTGSLGEISFDTEIKTLRVHDSATAGGFELVNTNQVQTISNKTIGSDLLPSVDSAYDLGSPSAKWKDLYLSGSTIFLGTLKLSDNNGTLAVTDSSGTLQDGNFANLTVDGNLTVNGSTTTINSTTLDVEDLNITVAKGSIDSTAANGAGITVDGANATITYVSSTDTWDLNKPFGTTTNVLSNYTTSNLVEGSNLYYTLARADSDAKNAVSVTDTGGDGSLTYSADTGVFTYTGPSAAEVRAHFSGGTGITITDGIIATNDAQIVHDNLSGFVANEHVDHSSVTLTAGRGLTGGGDITTSRTFAIDSADFLANFESSINHDNLTGFVADEHVAHSSVSITAGSGLTGGGDITASRTLNIGEGTGITVSADAISTNDAEIVHDNLSGFVANEHIDHSAVTLTAGNGLTGGGNITASRTFTVGAGTGVTVNADNVAIGQDVATTANVTFNSVTTTDGLIVGGDLQVNGTTTTISSQNLSIQDNMIFLNQLESAGSPTISADVGWAANVNDDGTFEHVGMFRDATDNTFKVFEKYLPDPSDTVEINTGDASFSLAPFAARTLSGIYLGADSDIDARLSGGTGITYNSGVISTNDAQIIHDNLSGFVANEHIDHSGVTITAGAGLTGGGTIAASRTLNVGAGTHIIVNADNIAVDATSANTASKVVVRDASGNFSAGTITATLSGNASTTTALATARTIGGVSFNGTANINLPGVNIAGNQNTTGSAATLTTTRTIFGQNFNGSANVSGALSGATTIAMSGQLTNTVANGTAPFVITSTTRVANLNVARAGTADVLTTARTIGGVSFNGSANINLPGVNTAGNQNTTGSAASLTTARTINGINFNGTANITVPGNFSNRTTNESGHAVFIGTTATGNLSMFTNTNYRFNPGTGQLSATDFNSTSDENLKKNITTIQNASSKLAQLRGVNFDWKDNDRYAMGVVAQEVEKIIPEVVNEENGIKSVSYGSIVGLLIEAIKDLQQQVNDLKS